MLHGAVEDKIKLNVATKKPGYKNFAFLLFSQEMKDTLVGIKLTGKNFCSPHLLSSIINFYA